MKLNNWFPCSFSVHLSSSFPVPSQKCIKRDCLEQFYLFTFFLSRGPGWGSHISADQVVCVDFTDLLVVAVYIIWLPSELENMIPRLNFPESSSFLLLHCFDISISIAFLLGYVVPVFVVMWILDLDCDGAFQQMDRSCILFLMTMHASSLLTTSFWQSVLPSKVTLFTLLSSWLPEINATTVRHTRFTAGEETCLSPLVWLEFSFYHFTDCIQHVLKCLLNI